MVRRLSIAILAAGASKRLGQPKQLIQVRGESLLKRSIKLAESFHPEQLLVAVSDLALMAAAEVHSTSGVAVLVPDAELGMSASLRAAAAAMGDQTSHLLILLVDQHRVDQTWINALLSESRNHPDLAIASRYLDGNTGVPAIFPASWFPRLQNGTGDQGARLWLRADPAVRAVHMQGEPGDVDSLEDLHSLS